MGRINTKEMDIITDWIEHVGYGSSKAVPALIEYWETAKSNYLFNLFGDKLIHEKEVTIAIPTDEYRREFEIIRRKYAQFFSNLDKLLCQNNFYLVYESTRYNYWGSEAEEHILWYYETSAWHTVTAEMLKDNKLDVNILVLDNIIYSNGSGIVADRPVKRFDAGGKVTRFLRFLVKLIEKQIDSHTLEYFNSEIDAFSVELSRLQQITTITGNLCISIHPMDYWTMSDNYCDWCSCMSWTGGGEYKSGTLEMCNSECVIVAYLKSSVNMDNGWNSKRWRELFVVNKEMILGIKGYPYASEPLENEVIKMLRELAEKNLGWTYRNEEPIRLRRNTKTALDPEFIFSWEVEFEKMYNDCYGNHPVIVGSEVPMGTHIEVMASGQAYCIITGEPLPHECPEYLLYHPRYDDLRQCPRCGYWYREYDEGGYADKWDEYVCDSCLEAYYEETSDEDEDDD